MRARGRRDGRLLDDYKLFEKSLLVLESSSGRQGEKSNGKIACLSVVLADE
jgi:hypothetical protein